ncbi:sensor domain-containing diguanylate cyclase [Gilvimarinus agarilyticus]|uniref:sensor domain-containing diguanylate cyclase n=1 Tax=Gilvimarinus sp. 2_MG-2023 TaxID=3062666 RepID=UPI001C098D12|nr:sensor domain-containing diguanylate cyclase [Gilvimarinus sp. 2_MG-2023]MBU2887794.1 sensor domain-containing diguanylate cyclase [Gilvimarinus agarilyticus]MDO6572433.1 sensor domain-containing diguanylate cyclase [Gilvimarinus sp. 2_MG-2023]
MTSRLSHLLHIRDHKELRLYELIPDVVWIFDVDDHKWWWGNQAAIDFWGLANLDELINKDLSGDTQGARDRTWQTFELAQQQGLTIDPWTTYPQGKPKTLYMRHRAVLVGPDKHRAIIAYINEQVNLGETPENLLLVEAMRYTRVLVTSFDMNGTRVTENPAATEAYPQQTEREAGVSEFVARFVRPEDGRECLQKAKRAPGGRWTYEMRTAQGVRRHTLDIRHTRHPLTGDFLLLMVEYDVTDLQQALDDADQAKSQLQKMAHYDPLTQLPNLRLFERQGAAILSSAQRAGSQVAILFIDLDGFKAVNDQYGHQTGDVLLKAVAERLQEHCRQSDLLARIGGDEFVLLQSNVTDRANVEHLANKLVALIAQPFRLGGVSQPLTLGGSIGIACYPVDGEQMQVLLDKADQAMYQVKQSGKSHYTFYTPESQR